MTHCKDTPRFDVIKADTLLGEGPLWCARTQTLWWIDGSRPQLLRWRWGASAAQTWALPRPPAALALMQDHRLLVAFRERFGVVSDPHDGVRDLTMPDLALGEERFNDAKVDRAGRLWIGTIDRALRRPIGRLRRFDAQGMHIMAQGFALSNGIGWSPDDRSLYFSESMERRVYRFDHEPCSGAIGAMTNLADLSAETPGPKPDGLTVDAEGGIWCVVFGGGRIDRYLPDGSRERSLRLPVSNPTSCMFGGPDLRTLFVTTATYGLTPAQAAHEGLAGSVLAIPMDVAGLAETPLATDNVLACAALSTPH